MPKKYKDKLCNRHTLAVVLAKYTDALKERGLKIEVSKDQRKLKKVMAKVEDWDQSEQSSIDYFDFTDNAFWIAAYNGKGRCVSLQAARLDRLGEKCLADHWKNQLPRLHGGKIGKMHAPIVYEMCGNIVYHGDLKTCNSILGDNTGSILCGLGVLQSLIEFPEMDYIYGFMRNSISIPGIPYRSLYAHTTSHATDWIKPPKTINPKDGIVVSTRDDVFHRSFIIDKYGLESAGYIPNK